LVSLLVQWLLQKVQKPIRKNKALRHGSFEKNEVFMLILRREILFENILGGAPIQAHWREAILV
jgi:hypothetical protein